MNDNQIYISANHIRSLLATRKMVLEDFANLSVTDQKVKFENINELIQLSNETCLPVTDFLSDMDSDLDDGIVISRKNSAFSRKEVRDGELYYTYHHLATTKAEPSLMALRLDLHTTKATKPSLNSGHNSKELVYVTKGVVQVNWLSPDGSMREDILHSGDSIFIWPNTPHSFISVDHTDQAEIIAINYQN